jgi:hypothetical protein
MLPRKKGILLTVDNRIPYYVHGNEQDDPSYRGPSRVAGGSFGGGQIPRSAWQQVGGGESGWATPDPVDPQIIWSSSQLGLRLRVLSRWSSIPCLAEEEGRN